MRAGIGACSWPAPRGGAALLAGVPVPYPPGAAEGGAGRELLVPAVVDALLGAAGLGDFRSRFGADRPADSPEGTADLLASAARVVERENYQVVNVDVSLRGLPDPAEGLAGRVAERLASSLHTAPSAVSVKWSAEPAGAVPPGALVVVLLDQIADIDALHASIRGG